MLTVVAAGDVGHRQGERDQAGFVVTDFVTVFNPNKDPIGTLYSSTIPNCPGAGETGGFQADKTTVCGPNIHSVKPTSTDDAPGGSNGVAQADTDAAWAKALRSAFPRPPGRGSITARAIQTRSLVHIPDVLLDPEFELTEAARASSVRSTLSVPMIREGEVIGAITVDRGESKPFLDKQIGLVKIFADQAVIAIENVRLFKELEEKNLALTDAHAQVTEALEQQTATSEILRVISQSQTDVQPVFDTIVRSAVKLCDGLFSSLFRFDGELIHLIAQHNFTLEALEAAHRVYPAPPTRALLTGRAILERAVAHIPDVEIDPASSAGARELPCSHPTTVRCSTTRAASPSSTTASPCS
ncbi:MAG: GAF domain-containing protein [Actinobacteria bacterium]|nr:MAG: GAF domain-containing protein [Actinomycetota bacterium]